MSEALTIEQFVEYFKLGRTTVFLEIKTGRLKTYKVGRRRYISSHAAAEWQRRLEAASSGFKQPNENAAHA